MDKMLLCIANSRLSPTFIGELYSAAWLAAAIASLAVTGSAWAPALVVVAAYAVTFAIVRRLDHG